MVGHYYAVRAVTHAAPGLVATHDALDQELPLDERAHAVKVLPGDRRGLSRFLYTRNIDVLIDRCFAHEVVRIIDVAVGAGAWILPHRTRQRLVVPRPVIVDGEYNGAAAGALRALDDPARHLPVVRGVDLLPHRCAARGHHFLRAGRAGGRKHHQCRARSGSTRGGELAFRVEGTLRADRRQVYR